MNARQADILLKGINYIRELSTGGFPEESLREIHKTCESVYVRLVTEKSDFPAAFDCYEIRKVAEYRSADGSTFCEPIDNNIVDAKASPDFVRSFWTLYGHMSCGGVMAIADYDDETTCEEMLKLIGGKRSV